MSWCNFLKCGLFAVAGRTKAFIFPLFAMFAAFGAEPVLWNDGTWDAAGAPKGKLLSDNPRKRFGIQSDPGTSIWNLEEEYTVDPADFLSQGKATPFKGWKVFGRCMETAYKEIIVWKCK